MEWKRGGKGGRHGLVGGAFFSGTEGGRVGEKAGTEGGGFFGSQPHPTPKKGRFAGGGGGGGEEGEEEEEERKERRSLTNSERCDGELPNSHKAKFK